MNSGKPLAPGCKYSKKEVMCVFSVFNKLDVDGNGKVKGDRYAGRVNVRELVEMKDQLNIPAMTHVSFIRGRYACLLKTSMQKAVDKNRDGVITFDELLKTLYPLASERELKVMYRWAYPEVVKVPQPPLFEPSEELKQELKDMFKMYDKNKNGVLEYQEVLDLTVKAGYDEEEVTALFKEADQNGDQVISYDEFIQLMCSSYIK